MTPAYLDLGMGELTMRAEEAWQRLSHCTLCPRECGVNRMAGEMGACRTASLARLHGGSPHHGEESVLVGQGGSGTIFFAGCNLDCLYCQNHEISHAMDDRGLTVSSIGDIPDPDSWRYAEVKEGVGIWKTTPRWAESPEYVARLMMGLQAVGCENINFVSPSHVVPQILAALVLAADRGLHLPLVYNTGGYDALETLYLLDGIIDIYMPDFKLSSEEQAQRYLHAADYGERAREAIAEMHRQVGVLRCTPDGIACRGVLVRHLVMPGLLSESAAVFSWLSEGVSRDTYVNIMGQYRPSNRVDASHYAEINRPVSVPEMQEAFRAAREAGLWRFD